MTGPHRRIVILTTGRQDYGILRSTIVAMRKAPDFEVAVWAGGMHFSGDFGEPGAILREDGIPVDREVRFLDSPPNPVQDAGRALCMFGDALETERPEAMLLVGDRSETVAAGVAATIMGVPLLHLHGGEETVGAIDNALRHALTKLSHVHFVSHVRHAKRVIQMGEDPNSVVVVGAPGLDNRFRPDLPSRSELEGDLGLSLEKPVVVVTVHSATLGGNPGVEVQAVAEALAQVPATYIITQPNSDAGSSTIRAYWSEWVRGRDRVRLVNALGERRYWGLLNVADAMVGNSSSGIIEAPSVGIPVINVGDRQAGRMRAPHVVDVPPEADAVLGALVRALDPEVRRELAGLAPIYMDGPAAPRILSAIRRLEWPVSPRKTFRDLD